MGRFHPGWEDAVLPGGVSVAVRVGIIARGKYSRLPEVANVAGAVVKVNGTLKRGDYAEYALDAAPFVKSEQGLLAARPILVRSVMTRAIIIRGY